MTYTAPEVVLIITAIGAILQNTISIWRTGNKVADTFAKTSVIEGHVNSQTTRYDEKVNALQKEIDMLKQVIVDKDKMTALLVQANAESVKPIIEKILPIIPKRKDDVKND